MRPSCSGVVCAANTLIVIQHTSHVTQLHWGTVVNDVIRERNEGAQERGES